MKILIVDDIPTNLRLLRTVLETQGFEVVEAANGVEGLVILEGETVDAIISDILMPAMDSYRFCKEVRRREGFCRLPFMIYTSTHTSAGDELLAQEMGADKYMTKRASRRDLTGAVHELVRRGSDERRPLLPEDDPRRSRAHNEALLNKLDERHRELSERTIHLRASEEKFRKLAESISGILWNEPQQGLENLPLLDEARPEAALEPPSEENLPAL